MILLQTTSNKNIHKGYVTTEKGQIHYWTAGKGPTLLLIHQSSSAAEEYAGLVPFLENDFHLIAFDLPGHGQSDDPEEELEVEGYMEAAKAVLDHLNIKKCHVLGHHGGAVISICLAWKYPNLVDKMILSGTSGIKKAAATKAFADNLEKLKKDDFSKDGIAIKNAFVRYTNYLPSANLYQVLLPFMNNIMARVRPFDAHAAILRWNRQTALNEMKDKDILLIQGDLDSFVSLQETLLTILPKAKRKVIIGGGAFMFYDKARECAEVIQANLKVMPKQG